MKYKIANFNYYVDYEGNVYNSKGELLNQYYNIRDGYRIIDLYKDGKRIKKNVHRLVAETLIPNPDNLPCVNHIDGNKQNNRVTNLEWVTYSENSLHSYKHNLQKAKKGSDNPNAVLTEDVVKTICEMLSQGYRNIDISKKLNVPGHFIKQIRARKTWNHISDRYVFPSRSRTLSEETIHWICRQICEGLTNTEILKASNNKNVTKSLISKIKCRTLYKEITKEYNF